MMTKADYLHAEDFCKQAVEELKKQIEPYEWIEKHKVLYESLTKLDSQGKEQPNSIFENYIHFGIVDFHLQYKSFLKNKRIVENIEQEHAFIYFFQNMDTYNIEKLLEVKTCQDIEKHKYMEHMHEAFEEMQLRGNTFLVIKEGICQGCNPGLRAYCFTGNFDKSHIELFLEIDPHTKRITDVYECLKMDCDDGFKPEYSKKIRIHQFKLKT